MNETWWVGVVLIFFFFFFLGLLQDRTGQDRLGSVGAIVFLFSLLIHSTAASTYRHGHIGITLLLSDSYTKKGWMDGWKRGDDEYRVTCCLLG
jgi:hypothetical protein